jgi:flagellar protein FliS
VNALNRYQSDAIATAGPAQLVLMMFDGATTALMRARSALVGGGPSSFEVSHRELQRCQDIIWELRTSLDRERGGAIASGLGSLYDYCLAQLVQANISKDASKLDIVEEILRDLRGAWAEACCGLESGESRPAPEPPSPRPLAGLGASAGPGPAPGGPAPALLPRGFRS